MKRFWNISLLAMLVLALFTGCAKDDDDDADDAAFQLLIDYLEGDGGNYVNSAAPKVVSATTVNTNMELDPDYYTILDIRMGDKYGPGTEGANGVHDYDEGHITGAVNVALADVVTYCADNSVAGPIVVACYTGHDAGHAVLALNVMGYDAYSLGWGMSGWNTDFDLWTSHTGSDHGDSFVTDVAPSLPADGDSPVIDTALETGEAILAERVSTILSGGLAGVTTANLFASLDDYYIVNYFGEEDYLGNGGCPAGHIDGAYQYTPILSLQTAEDIFTLPTDKTIAVYCWTGQHGSQIAAFLNILGYTAVDVKFGVNGMVYDQLTGHKWDATTVPELGYVESAPEVTEYDLLVEYLEGDGGNYFTDTAPRVVGAAAVWDFLDADPNHYTILDVRTGDYYGPGTEGANGTPDFEDGHSEGAFNVGYKEVVTYCDDNSVTGPILVYCYTGHTAGYSVAALNLSGYEAYSMSFGFSAWHSDFDMWTAATSDDYIGDFVTDAAPALPAAGDQPVIPSTLTTGEEIFAEQLAATMVEGFRGITAADVMANPDDYYIVNYWSEADYLGNGACPDGHIDGAYQYTPNLSLQSFEDLYTLPADETIVVYCWTGQHGSQVALLLNMLGYDAKDLKFGVNGMVHTNLTGHKWAASMDYDYVTGL